MTTHFPALEAGDIVSTMENFFNQVLFRVQEKFVILFLNEIILMMLMLILYVNVGETDKLLLSFLSRGSPVKGLESGVCDVPLAAPGVIDIKPPRGYLQARSEIICF